MREKCRRIYTVEQMNRIIWQSDNYIRVDVHGMSKNKALHFIQGILLLNDSDNFVIEVVHGYHGGTAIKDALTSEFHTRRKCRLQRTHRNPGITKLIVGELKAA